MKFRTVLRSSPSFEGLTLARRLLSPGAWPGQIHFFQIQNFTGGAFPAGASAEYMKFEINMLQAGVSAKYKKW